MKFGILVSGDLGYDVVKKLSVDHKPEFIATDKMSTDIIDLANSKRIPLFIGNPRSSRLASFMVEYPVYYLLSINYIFLIEKDVIDNVRYAVNFHGALLPKYRGRTPHIWAIINNEKETGVTAHLIDEGCDTGPIISQKAVPIDDNLTGYDILKLFSKLYIILINDVIGHIKSNTLTYKEQDHSIATFFGKRVPEDGEINWNWQRERIYNWIRAQAYPYPGAYTWLDNTKIIIDKVEFSNFGFDFMDENGKVLNIVDNCPIIKTPNGALICSKIRNSDIIRNLKIGVVLGEYNE